MVFIGWFCVYIIFYLYNILLLGNNVHYYILCEASLQLCQTVWRDFFSCFNIIDINLRRLRYPLSNKFKIKYEIFFLLHFFNFYLDSTEEETEDTEGDEDEDGDGEGEGEGEDKEGEKAEGEASTSTETKGEYFIYHLKNNNIFLFG